MKNFLLKMFGGLEKMPYLCCRKLNKQLKNKEMVQVSVNGVEFNVMLDSKRVKVIPRNAMIDSDTTFFEFDVVSEYVLDYIQRGIEDQFGEIMRHYNIGQNSETTQSRKIETLEDVNKALNEIYDFVKSTGDKALSSGVNSRVSQIQSIIGFPRMESKKVQRRLKKQEAL